MSKRSVAVLFGGNSSEYEVSLMSATSVLSNIPTDRYQIHMVGITKEGQWIYYTGPVDEIQNGVWCEHPDNRLAWISPEMCIRDRSHVWWNPRTLLLYVLLCLLLIPLSAVAFPLKIHLASPACGIMKLW